MEPGCEPEKYWKTAFGVKCVKCGGPRRRRPTRAQQLRRGRPYRTPGGRKARSYQNPPPAKYDHWVIPARKPFPGGKLADFDELPVHESDHESDHEFDHE